ncbi:MAG: OmpA family protein, partial [Lentimicrobium sp.]|nr:OmpA family protein [Lentimicrobium sp.]
SQKRAESAVRYIILQGVDPSRIIAKGYGETKLINQCADGIVCSEPEHQANRRTEFRILSIDKPSKGKKFDPSIFKVGDNVDVYLFDPDFFQECFGITAEQKVDEPEIKSETTIPTAPEAVKPPANIQKDDCFCVQLLATSTELPSNSKELKGVQNARSYYTGKWYKYVTGCEKTYEEAAILQKSIIEQGFPEAFIVKVENGKIVSAR